MAKKTPNKTKVKRFKRSRRVNKKIPVPMAHLGASLTLWGLDSREWLDDPLIWSLRGQPDPTMPMPSWGWFRFDAGRYHQINQPYDTQFPEPDDTLLPPASVLNTVASPPVLRSTMDGVREGHNGSRHINRQYSTHDATPNEGQSHTLPSLTNPSNTTPALSLVPHDIVSDVQEGDSGQGCRSLSILTIPDSLTGTESLLYTLSSSSTNSSDQLPEPRIGMGATYDSTPSYMTGSSSNPAPLYTSSGPTTFQLLQQHPTVSAAPFNLSADTTTSISTAYSTPNSYPPYHLPAPDAGQNWSRHMAYLSHNGTGSSYLSVPSPQLAYPNMAGHSLAPMIPYMGTVPNHRHTHSVPHNRDGHSLGTNFADPSQVSQVSQTSNRSHLLSAVPDRLGRRAHATPAFTGNRQTPRSFPAATRSGQLHMGTNYNWNPSYLGSNLNINPTANPATGGQGAEHTRNSGPSDGMHHWIPRVSSITRIQDGRCF